MGDATELLGRRIKELRKKRGFSQEQLGELIGIDQKHMSKIELGKSYPSLDRLIRLSDVLGVQLPELFDFEYFVDPMERKETMSEMIDSLGERERQLLFRIIQVLHD